MGARRKPTRRGGRTRHARVDVRSLQWEADPAAITTTITMSEARKEATACNH
jgi:hypothetical protein